MFTRQQLRTSPTPPDSLDPERNLDDGIARHDEDDLFRHGKIVWWNEQVGDFEEVYV